MGSQAELPGSLGFSWLSLLAASEVTGPLVGEELEATPWRSIWSWMIYPKAEDTGGYEGPGLGHASLQSTARALLHHRCIQEHQVTRSHEHIDLHAS